MQVIKHWTVLLLLRMFSRDAGWVHVFVEAFKDSAKVVIVWESTHLQFAVASG